jgi:site-specific recombinase XerD
MLNKNLKVHNKSSKPTNVVAYEHGIIQECLEMEKLLPDYFYDYFLYLQSSVAISTRLAYLLDLKFFLNYMINESPLSSASSIRDIPIDDIKGITAKDVNRYIGGYCSRYLIEQGKQSVIMENHNRSLSRKKSSLSVLFKFLYREEIMSGNITDAFNPIKLPKPQPDAIKRLDTTEVRIMFDCVASGEGLTEKEMVYWKKTKHRDMLILLLFTTYGLRLMELQQLNISSFNLNRGEFLIYRKRGKESSMPINKSIERALADYLNIERSRYASKEEDALLLSMQKKRLTLKSIRDIVKKYTAIAMGTTKKNGYSPHKLRATAATSLIEEGFSIYDVKNLLDHDNVTTTQLYSAYKRDQKREIIKNYELLDDD